jgi:hypothetical protein
VLSGEKHADLGVLSFLLQLLHFAREIVQNVLAFIRQFSERLEVFDLTCQLGIQLDILFQIASLLERRLRFFLVVPEFGTCYFSFELENLCTFAVCIKDTL